MYACKGVHSSVELLSIRVARLESKTALVLEHLVYIKQDCQYVKLQFLQQKKHASTALKIAIYTLYIQVPHAALEKKQHSLLLQPEGSQHAMSSALSVTIEVRDLTDNELKRELINLIAAL